MDLYALKVTITGELSEVEFARLDEQLGGPVMLAGALQQTLAHLIAETSFSDRSRFDLTVAVEID